MKLFNFQKQVETAEEPQKGASREYPELKETEQTANVIEQDWWWQPFWTFSALFIFAGVLWRERILSIAQPGGTQKGPSVTCDLHPHHYS